MEFQNLGDALMRLQVADPDAAGEINPFRPECLASGQLRGWFVRRMEQGFGGAFQVRERLKVLPIDQRVCPLKDS